MGCCKGGGGPPGSWWLTDAAVQGQPRLTLVPERPSAPPAPQGTPWWVWALVGLLAFSWLGKRA